MKTTNKSELSFIVGLVYSLTILYLIMLTSESLMSGDEFGWMGK
jgi:hypothetical protein